MKKTEVTVVRIYLNEGQAQLQNLIKRLHDWERLKGVTVYRGIAGYGESGEVHTGRLIDLSLELPLVVEFFDEPAKIETIMAHLNATTKSGHMLSWTAYINEPED